MTYQENEAQLDIRSNSGDPNEILTMERRRRNGGKGKKRRDPIYKQVPKRACTTEVHGRAWARPEHMA